MRVVVVHQCRSHGVDLLALAFNFSQGCHQCMCPRISYSSCLTCTASSQQSIESWNHRMYEYFGKALCACTIDGINDYYLKKNKNEAIYVVHNRCISWRRNGCDNVR